MHRGRLKDILGEAREPLLLGMSEVAREEGTQSEDTAEEAFVAMVCQFPVAVQIEGLEDISVEERERRVDGHPVPLRELLSLLKLISSRTSSDSGRGSVRIP